MTPSMVGKDAGTARAGEYAQHRPEQTLLYQLIEAHYPAFVAHLAAREGSLPTHVQREFEDYLKCGRLEYYRTHKRGRRSWSAVVNNHVAQ